MNRIRASLLARDIGSLWVGQGVVLAASLIQAAVVTRLLGPRGFGTAYLVIGSVTLVYTILNPQSSDTVIRYLTRYVEQDDRERARALPRLLLLADAALALVATAFVAATAWWAADHVVREPGTAWLLIAYSGLVAMSAPSLTATSVLAVFGRFPTVARIQAAVAVLRAAGVTAAVAAGAGVTGLVVGTGIGVAVEGAILVALAEGTLRTHFGAGFATARLSAMRGQRREVLRFTGYTALTTLATAAIKHADLVILGAIAGPTQAGYYRLARTLNQPFGAVLTPMQSTVFPRITRIVDEGEAGRLRATLRRYIVYLGAPISAMTLVVVVFVPLAIRVVAGSQFAPAAPAARILILGSAITVLLFWLRPTLLALQEVRFLLASSAVASAVSAIGFVVVARPWGATGVAGIRMAVATLLASIVLLLHLVPRIAQGTPTWRSSPGASQRDDDTQDRDHPRVSDM